jgi:His/Glu/Gln/Arg/opine family amino acid ABC transporter permease subunit
VHPTVSCPLADAVADIVLASLDFTVVRTAAPDLARGFALTVGIAAAGTTGALVLGAVGAAMRVSDVRWARALATAFTEFFRNTPPLVQIYFLAFALPKIPGVGPYLVLPGIVAATLGLILHQGAINVEILRSGLEAVPLGQREAAATLGLGRVDTLRYVLVPQAVRICLPALGNNVISLFKNTTLVASIGVLDLFGVANDIIAQILVSAELFITVGVVYLISIGLLGAGFRALEKRLAYAR